MNEKNEKDKETKIEKEKSFEMKLTGRDFKSETEEHKKKLNLKRTHLVLCTGKETDRKTKK